MADKSISELPVSQGMTDDALLVVYQNGETESIEGSLIKQYARESTKQYVEGAKQSAANAEASADAAQKSRDGVEEYEAKAKESADAAESSAGAAQVSAGVADAAKADVAANAAKAKASADNAKTSETASKASETAAGKSATDSDAAKKASQAAREGVENFAEQAGKSAGEAAESAAAAKKAEEAAKLSAKGADASAKTAKTEADRAAKVLESAVKQDEIGAPNGIAPLDADKRVPVENCPYPAQLGGIPFAIAYTPEGGVAGQDYAVNIPGITEYTENLIIKVKFNANNAGKENLTTLNVNGVGALSVKRSSRNGYPLSEAKIQLRQSYIFSITRMNLSPASALCFILEGQTKTTFDDIGGDNLFPDRGGTGRSEIADDSYLVGRGGNAMDVKTPAEVRAHIGAVASVNGELPDAEGNVSIPSGVDSGKAYTTYTPVGGADGVDYAVDVPGLTDEKLFSGFQLLLNPHVSSLDNCTLKIGTSGSAFPVYSTNIFGAIPTYTSPAEMLAPMSIPLMVFNPLVACWVVVNYIYIHASNVDGAVQKVNGILPDASGNVTVTAQSLSDMVFTTYTPEGGVEGADYAIDAPFISSPPKIKDIIKVVFHTTSTTVSPKLHINRGYSFIRRGSTLTTKSLISGSIESWLKKDSSAILIYTEVNIVLKGWSVLGLAQPNASDISGTIGVPNGGSGNNSVSSGSILIGNGINQMIPKTPEEIRTHIGAAPASQMTTLLAKLVALNVITQADADSITSEVTV